MFAVVIRKLMRQTNLHVSRLRVYTAISCVYSGLSQQCFNLLGANPPSEGTLLPLSVPPSLRREYVREGQRNDRHYIFVMYESCVGCPISASYGGSAGESYIKRECLIDQSKPVSSFHHPPHVSRSAFAEHPKCMGNPDLCEHFDQPGSAPMAGFWITEDLKCDPLFHEYELKYLLSERIIVPQANHQGRLRYLLDMTDVVVYRHWQNRAVQSALVDSLKYVSRIASRQFDLAPRKHAAINITKVLQEMAGHER